MSAPALTIHLFGPMRVLIDGEPMPRVRTRSIEWLLALLVLRHGRAVERSWLAGTLWLDSEEDKALHNLRHALVHLRKALGSKGARIQSPTRDTLTLDLEGAEVDILAFDAALKEGDEDALQRAVALYTGPLLEGCYEAWVGLEREYREQACLNALETMARREEERGKYGDALALLRRAEAIDGLRDSIQRSLMRVLTASGDTPAALLTYREYRQRLHREMNVEPDAETTRLFQRIRATGKSPTPRAEGEQAPQPEPPTRTMDAFAPAPLPHSITSLIGREEAVREVVRQITGSRLVTLVGTGGVGKTRLCIQAAHEAAEQFPQGAAFVTLTSLSDPALLPSFVASALGMRTEGSADETALLSSLAGWLSVHEVLLILDNCEHLIEATAELCQTLLELCPRLHILATSRQRLGLTGEVAWRVPSLHCPDLENLPQDEAELIEVVSQSPAVQLFTVRAEMVSAGFRLIGREEAEAVAHICQRLDGIPLAIELAAARAGVLTLPQIAARLDDRFRLLISGSRGGLTRHQTLRALIDWSYALLTEDEQALLCHLSVFVGGWTLEAAEAVLESNVHAPTTAPLLQRATVLDLLTSLMDKSLIVAEDQAGGLRYRMLETVCGYSLEKLQESGDLEAARGRHGDYFLALAKQAEPFLYKPEPAWLERLETEHDNLRAALTYYCSQEESVDKAVRMVVALEVFWSLRGYMHERRTWLMELSRRQTPPTRAWARMLTITGWMIDSMRGDSTLGKQYFAESLAIMQQLGDQKGIAEALSGLAVLESDADEALSRAGKSVAIMRELGDRQGIADSLYYRGRIARQIGNLDIARDCWMEANALNEAMGQKGALVLWRLGELAIASGDYAEARFFFARFVTERHEIGDRWSIAWGLRGFSELALAEGHTERAAAILGASITLKESLANPLPEVERVPYEVLRSMLRDTLGDAALSAAWAEGQSMTYEQAVEFALQDYQNAGQTGDLPSPPAPSTGSSFVFSSPSATLPHSITALIGREAAVAELVQCVATSRLVTLVGTGGVGKTRLCMQVASEVSGPFPQGAVFVALAPLAEPALLPSFVASALGMREEETADAATWLKMLSDWFSMHPVLLVLDNCEHLIETVATLCQTLLERCPRLHILATSRQRLGLTGEVVWRVPSLSAPTPEQLPSDTQDAADYAVQYPAVQLFVERVVQALPDFRLTDLEDIRAVARICYRLDGIPLALELAAARTQALSLSQIAARLDNRFLLLTGGSRTALPRQQTLRALIDWSYELLSELERRLLRRLSVFAGGWTLESAEYLNTSTSECQNTDDILDVLVSLVEQSLVLAEESPGGRRYRMLETVREYALERLRESGEEDAARNQHLGCFQHLAQECGPLLRGSDLEAALERVEAEIGNFREALRWAQNEAPPEAYVQLTAALWPFWEVRGYHTEGRDHLRAALKRPSQTDAPERAQALLGAATLAFVQADWATVHSSGQEGVEIFRALADPRGLAAGLLLLGYASGRMGELDESRTFLTEALACCRECGWNQGTVLAYSYLGITAELEGDLTLARSFWQQSVALSEATGDTAALALSLHYTGRILGHLALETGDDARVHALLERSLLHWRRLGDTHKVALTLCILGDVSRSRQGNPVLACAYYEEAVAAWREQGNRNRLAAALHEMGNALYEQGDYERARSVYAESLTIFDQVEEDYGRDFARVNLGSTLFHLGQPIEAQALFREALPLYQRKALAEGIVWTLERLGIVEAMYGDARQATQLLGAVSVARAMLGIPLSRSDQADWDRAVAAVRSALDAKNYTALWAEGSAWTLDQAIEYALKNT